MEEKVINVLKTTMDELVHDALHRCPYARQVRREHTGVTIVYRAQISFVPDYAYFLTYTMSYADKLYIDVHIQDYGEDYGEKYRRFYHYEFTATNMDNLQPRIEMLGFLKNMTGKKDFRILAKKLKTDAEQKMIHEKIAEIQEVDV